MAKDGMANAEQSYTVLYMYSELYVILHCTMDVYPKVNPKQLVVYSHFKYTP